MLKNIDPALGPELLAHLRAMGHGDELAIVDANFPAASSSKRLVRMDGLTATQVLRSVLSVLPLDTYVATAVQVMQVVGTQDTAPIAEDFRRVAVEAEGERFGKLGALERHAFYERARQCYLVISTGEQRLYGNVIVTKGVIEAASGVFDGA